jgi:tetratricopeptide (TPR) repeat protein
MNRSRSFVSLCELLLLFALLLRTGARAQSPGSIGGILGPESLNTTSISVQVRGADGTKFNSMAIVNLSNAFGQMVRSQITYGSQTVFQVGAGMYVVEVEAFGYEKARVKTEVSSARPQQAVVVTLKPDTANGLNYVALANVQLSPKAQKEMAKAVEYFQNNKFDEAIKHLESAHQLAPAHPDVVYLLGVSYEKKNDLPAARKYWDQAIQLNPAHLSSLLACAESYLHQNDAEGARKYLDKAVEAAPNSWRAQSLMANVLLRQNSYTEAVTHAQRAVELGKEQASPALLILGQALAAEQQNDQAIAALKDYLASKPPEQQAQAVQKLIARLSDAPSPSVRTTVGGVTTSLEDGALASDVPDLPPTAAALHWLPPNVDDAVPAVEPSVSCPLDDVIKNASARVQELPAVVDRYTATEVLHQEDVNNAGIAERVADLSFNYVASVREIKNKYGQSLDVQEYRNGSTGTEMFPNQMASVGLPSIVLIFHPILITDFEMKCEGLSRAHGNFAWQVYFRQREDKESHIRRYRMGGHVFPIALKGRAWIDANTFQVVYLETDLRESHPELRLNAEHLVMEYGPVKFKSRKEELWLPASADYYAALRGQRFHRRHSFTDYILFSIDDKQRIGEPPKEKMAEGSTNDKKSSN